MPLHSALALCYILAPEVSATEPPAPLSAFQALALEMQLLDPREAKWTFRDSCSFCHDRAMVRERYAEIGNAPPIEDAARFPGLELCRTMLRFNAEYQSWLTQRQVLFPTEEWIEEALRECDELRVIWNRLDDAQCAYYYVHVRRRALQQLREQIGVRFYYGACLAAPVPVWRFRRID